MRTLLTHRTHRLLRRHRRAKARASQGPGKGNMYQERRLRKEVRNLLFTAEEKQKLVDFLCDNEIFYNKRLMDYKDRSKREAVWDKFCEENYMPAKDGFRASHTLFRKVTHMKSGQGEPQLTERQKWTRDNIDFLRDHIVCHLTAKSEFRAPRESASQASAAAGSASRQETVYMEPFQDTSHPESTDDPADLSNLDTLLDCVVSV